MKSKLKLYFIVGLVLAALGIGASAYFVHGASQELDQANEDRSGAWNTLVKLHKQEPFPSAQNVDVLKDEVRAHEDAFARLNERLGRGQARPQELSPGKFINLLYGTRGKLREAASKGGVQIPDRFNFGFDAYSASQIPWQEEVGRLTQQLSIIETLCATIYDCDVEAMVSLTRETFEKSLGGAAASTPRPSTTTRSSRRGRRGASAPRTAATLKSIHNDGAGRVPSGELFGRFVFQFQVHATESAVFCMLDRLAHHEMFIVVDHVSYANAGVGVLPPKPYLVGEDGRPVDISRDGVPEGATRLAREKRLVSGPSLETPSLVTFRVSVYQFKEADAREVASR